MSGAVRFFSLLSVYECVCGCTRVQIGPVWFSETRQARSAQDQMGKVKEYSFKTIAEDGEDAAIFFHGLE